MSRAILHGFIEYNLPQRMVSFSSGNCKRNVRDCITFIRRLHVGSFIEITSH